MKTPAHTLLALSGSPTFFEHASRIVRLCAAALVCAVTSATALTFFSAAAHAEPPSRVGRVGLVEGDVSFYADRDEGWQKARINYPVTNENSIWTENQSRAEVRIGASALRIDDNSILDFLKVDDNRTEVYLQRGTLNVRTRSYGADTYRDGFRIQTNEGRFIIESNGRYRINASQESGESRIAVFAGRARFDVGNGRGKRITVDAGRTLIVRSSGDSTEPDIYYENANESQFDRWAEARDQRWDENHTRTVREQTISPYMTGYEDLDNYGDWVDDREYGRVWTPRVVATDWAPYRSGSWAYVRPWGWTWVDDSPWGFAPFHYGRWIYAGSRWAWWPGRYSYRPAYAPALVGWYGRPNVSISISVGPSIGWFPLAPREYYVPQYSNNVTYIRNINHITNNTTNITVINNPPARYANQMPGATFVSGNTFVNNRPIQSNRIKIAEKEMIAHPIMKAPNATPFPTEMGSRRLNAGDSNINSNSNSNANNVSGKTIGQPVSQPISQPRATQPAPSFVNAPAPATISGKPQPIAVQGQPMPVQQNGSTMPISPTSPTSPTQMPSAQINQPPKQAPNPVAILPAPIRTEPRYVPQPSYNRQPKPAQPAEATQRLPNAANQGAAPAAQSMEGRDANNMSNREQRQMQYQQQRDARMQQQAPQIPTQQPQGTQPAHDGRAQAPRPIEKAEKPAKPAQIEKQEKPEKREQASEPRTRGDNR